MAKVKQEIFRIASNLLSINALLANEAQFKMFDVSNRIQKVLSFKVSRNESGLFVANRLGGSATTGTNPKADYQATRGARQSEVESNIILSDTAALIKTFATTMQRVHILVEKKDALIRFDSVDEGIGALEIVPVGWFSFDVKCDGVLAGNRVTGKVSTVSITGYNYLA